MVGEGGLNLYTSDGGLTWSEQNGGVSSQLNTVSFSTIDQGLAGGVGGAMLYTKNGGKHWSAVPPPPQFYLSSSFMYDDAYGWFAGYTIDFIAGIRGYTYRTTNGGMDWLPESSHVTVDLTCIQMIGDSAGRITGLGGTLLRYTPDAVTGVEEESAPRDFALLRNYPKPFNPSTTIAYTLPERRHVLLSVSNVLGQLVAVLVDEAEGPGVHTVTWDGGGHPGGIYCCRITAGDFVGI